MKNKTILLTILLIVLLFGTTLSNDKSKSHWHYLADVYLMFPTMSGNITVDDLPPVEIDADAGNIFSHIKMGAMFYFEATNDDWAVSSDLIYMKLGQDLKPDRNLVTGGDVTMKQTAWELAGLKRIASWLEAGIGGRIVSLYTGLNLQTINEPREGSVKKTWFDPIVIIRTQGAIKDSWLLQFRGDIGGFSVGSDFSWQIQANAGYRFSKLFQATIGYRVIGINYDKGEGMDRFVYDVDTCGPVIHLGFNF